MNKYLIHGLLILSAALLVSCQGGKTETDETALTPRIENGEITFPPAGGVHTVNVVNATNITAAADLPWCTIQQSGSALQITAEPYSGVESRYNMIHINADGNAYYVVVQQSGVYIQNFDESNLNLKNGAVDIVRTFNTNASFSATTEEDWIHLTSDEGSLRIVVDENVGKEYREGTIHWNIGMLGGDIAVTQFDAAEAGLLGEYTLSAYNVKTKRTWTINAVLESSGEQSYTLKLTSGAYNLSIPVTMDKQTLLLPLGQPVGTYTLSSGTVYRVIPLIASGTAAVKYANAITTGNYAFVFDLQEDGKWVATGDHSPYGNNNFQFAHWLNSADYLTANSATNGVYLQELSLIQK